MPRGSGEFQLSGASESRHCEHHISLSTSFHSTKDHERFKVKRLVSFSLVTSLSALRTYLLIAYALTSILFPDYVFLSAHNRLALKTAHTRSVCTNRDNHTSRHTGGVFFFSHSCHSFFDATPLTFRRRLPPYRPLQAANPS